METSTYSVIMKVKYRLKAEQDTSLQKYHRKHTLKDPVDRSLVQPETAMLNAWRKTRKKKTKLNKSTGGKELIASKLQKAGKKKKRKNSQEGIVITGTLAEGASVG